MVLQAHQVYEIRSRREDRAAVRAVTEVEVAKEFLVAGYPIKATGCGSAQVVKAGGTVVVGSVLGNGGIGEYGLAFARQGFLVHLLGLCFSAQAVGDEGIFVLRYKLVRRHGSNLHCCVQAALVKRFSRLKVVCQAHKPLQGLELWQKGCLVCFSPMERCYCFLVEEIELLQVKVLVVFAKSVHGFFVQQLCSGCCDAYGVVRCFTHGCWCFMSYLFIPGPFLAQASTLVPPLCLSQSIRRT